MIEKKTWKEFKECKMLWWINMILHTFGWAICLEIENEEVISAYPARVKFRGFDEKDNSEGYMGVSKFMVENSRDLHAESCELN